MGGGVILEAVGEGGGGHLLGSFGLDLGEGEGLLAAADEELAFVKA